MYEKDWLWKVFVETKKDLVSCYLSYQGSKTKTGSFK